MIYPRYTTGELRPEHDGLMVRQFGDGTPYKGEDLVFDPTAPERFVARCSRAGTTPGIPLFDRNDHSFVPTCRAAERRAQALSRMPPCGTGEAGAKRPAQRRARRYNPAP